jgi:hypothetical protein
MKDRDELFDYSLDRNISGRETDPQLAEFLSLYEPPPASRRLDNRILESYRAQQTESGKTRFWARVLTSSVKVPAPLAAAVLLALIVAIAWVVYTPTASPARALKSPDPVPSVRIVEVPVIQERIVTRTVYLRTKPRRTGGKSNAARQKGSSLALFSSRAENGYVVQQSTDLRGFQPVPELKIQVLRRNDRNED